MDEVTSPVLIVGGGLTGLSAAAFLASHGVKSLLVERRAAPLPHPRARAINPRTVELYRGLGLEQDILDACSYSDSPDMLMIQAESLAAPPRHQSPLSDGGADRGKVSPCGWAPIGQHRLEALLADHAASRGARIRFGTELLDFTERPDGVTATIADCATGRRSTVRAAYLIAADGVRSPSRWRIGIPTTGPGVLGHTATFVFEADLSGPLRGRRLGIGHVDRPEVGTVLLPHDDAGSWVLSIPYHPERDVPASAFTRERCVAAVRAAVGVPYLRVKLSDQLPDGTKVLTWEIGARVAARFRSGRVFLAGDSAHVVPPTGALGASVGIQDAHNLAWRLAAVLTGQAGPELLDGYEAERRPVALLTLRHAMWQLSQRTGKKLAYAVDAEPLDYDAVVFGYRYQSAEIIPDGSDAGDPPAWHPRDLRGQPGTRAPHVELVRDGGSLSSIDLFGRAFVLLAAAKADGWAEAGRAVAGVPGVGLTIHQVGRDLEDPAGDFHERYGLGHDGAVLVRPDGFVAWRSAGGSKRPAEELADVLSRLLHRPDLTLPGDTPCVSS